VVSDPERRFLRDVGLEQLRSPPTVIGFHQRLRAVVQQAGEDDFLGHARLEGARGALQHVIGRSETQAEEVLERWVLRHRLELAHVAARIDEHIAGAAPIVARFDLCFELGDGWKFWRGALGFGLLVQLVFHPVFQRVCLGLGIHQADGSGASKTGDEGATINLHGCSPCWGRD
jgi:hypothetical protein